MAALCRLEGVGIRWTPRRSLIWLVEQGRWRLLLLGGWPELDVALEARDLADLRPEVLGLVKAWMEQAAVDGAAPVALPGWCVTADSSWSGCWADHHDSFTLGPLLSDADMSLVELALKAPAEVSG